MNNKRFYLRHLSFTLLVNKAYEFQATSPFKGTLYLKKKKKRLAKLANFVNKGEETHFPAQIFYK